MILNRTFVASMEAMCNELECRDCGKHHPVTLEWKGDVVAPRYSDGDTCLGFKEQVNTLLRTEISRRVSDPFPLLR